MKRIKVKRNRKGQFVKGCNPALLRKPKIPKCIKDLPVKELLKIVAGTVKKTYQKY